jgi:hypothetical protein
MKKTFLLLLIAAFAKLNAQTVDDVIQKHAKAMGGLDNFKQIKTAKFTGTVSVQGNDLPITVQVINGKAMRTDVDAMGQKVTNAYKDGKGWMINPFAGASTATDVTGDMLDEFKNQSYLVPALIDYKERGYKAQLMGQENVDSVKAYKIQLTDDKNKTDTYFIDANTYMLIKFSGTRNMMGQDMELETYFSDIKDAGNVKLAMSRSVKAGGQTIQEIHFDKVDMNVPIDEKIFDKP